MADIAFHFGASDPVDYACRLLRKATATGVRVLVVATEEVLQALDTALWGVSPPDFVAHCRSDATATMLAHSSVVLSVHSNVPGLGATVLVNIGGPVPEGFEQFSRVIEVVSTNDDDRQGARARWRHYTQCGYAITRHDLANSQR